MIKILKASAGSGKTFSLTLHYITLLLESEAAYREILAVTFTNRATAEMKERILSVLNGLALGRSDPRTADFRQALLERFPEWDADTIQEKSRRVFRSILHDYGRFTVSTIDGFSQKVIRGFTYELNLDSAYKIEMNTGKVKQELTAMLNRLLDERPDLLEWVIGHAERKIANNENWNYRQQLMDLAGLIFTENFQEFNAHLATADAKEVFRLLDRDVQEKTESFLRELEQAIRTFQVEFGNSGIGPDDLFGKTKNLLITASKIDPKVRKLAVSELQKTFDKFLKLIGNDTPYTDRSKAKNIRHDLKQRIEPTLVSIQELYRSFPEHIAYRAVRDNLYYLRLLKEMSDLLAQWRRENGAQLISDAQILLGKLGLDDNNDPSFIWEKIGNRYRYFLFDEFQDTSRMQWKNYSPLLLNALGSSTRGRNEHLIVGDVKQSIYRWRNGDWRILLRQVEEQIARTFHLSDAEKRDFIDIDTLPTNFRSHPNVIAFNNYLFERIPELLQSALDEKVRASLKEEEQTWWERSGNAKMLVKAYENSKQGIPTGKFPDSDMGSIEVEYLPVPKEGKQNRRNKVEEKSLERMCEKISEWTASGRYAPRQIGILVRNNKQVKTVIEALMRHKNETGAPFDVISGDALSLSANNAVLLLVETMKALLHGSDKHVLHRANMAFLYRNIHQNGSLAPDDWLRFKANRLDDLHGILPSELIAEWENLQKAPLVYLVEQLIALYGLAATESIHLPYLLAFKDLVSNFSINGERGLTHFLEYWEEDGPRAALPSNGKIDAVEVSTIHKAKGLAYDVVMIPFCSWPLDEGKAEGRTDNNFWVDTAESPFWQLGKISVKYNQSMGQSIFFRQYFEEMLFNYMDALNLFYVAVTRAVEHLYILAPGFADRTDNKTKETSPDIKQDYIGDMLFAALNREGSRFRLEDGRLAIDPASVRQNTENETLATDRTDLIEESNTCLQTIALGRYPIGRELQKAFEMPAKRSVSQALTREKAARYGILAHEIISQVTEESQIADRVAQFVENGVLAKEDRPFILREIQQTWNHPQLNKWFAGSYKIWNESAIILNTGETIRPDKVFTAETETIVLDFKFTKGDHIGHQYQVVRYVSALRNLGYANVKGYLYYAKIGELMRI